MIELRQVKKAYGRLEAVRGINFQADAGEVVGLLGPNGAGKTTTIRMVTAFMPPSSGSVSVGGFDTVSDSRAVRSRIGYLPESAAFYPEMRVFDYLRHRATLLGVPRSDRDRAIERSMERCWLTDVRRRRVGQLSKGYRQRVGLAAALVHDPPVLVLDEPTSGLDPAQIIEMRHLIRELGEDKTMLVSSHILPEVERTCDRVVVIARGGIRADGRLDELSGSLRSGATYVLESTGADPRAAFSGVPGVERIAIEPAEGSGASDWTRTTIHTASGTPDLREALAKAASDAGLIVRELRRDEPSLEELFVRLIDAAGEEETK